MFARIIRAGPHDASSVASAGAMMWLVVIRRYILFIILGNLLWEFGQLPLYTIWQQGSSSENVFAAVHCTGGDALIASASLLSALMLLGQNNWPLNRYVIVATAAIIFGLSYTVFSEWLNTNIRNSWTYNERMPVVLGIGLSPIAQWIVVPVAAFWLAARRG
jgi:hypothetical protein